MILYNEKCNSNCNCSCYIWKTIATCNTTTWIKQLAGYTIKVICICLCLQAHIDGYERIFGIFDELRILVTGETFQIQFATELQNSFKAVVHLTTNYSSNLNTTHFKATVIFKSGLSKVKVYTFSQQLITAFLSLLSYIY